MSGVEASQAVTLFVSIPHFQASLYIYEQQTQSEVDAKTPTRFWREERRQRTFPLMLIGILIKIFVILPRDAQTLPGLPAEMLHRYQVQGL